MDPVDEALADALTTTPDDTGELLTLDELAERSGLSPVVLEAVARDGLLVAHPDTDPPRYDASDVEVVRAGMALLEAGLPLGELLDLARRTDDALRQLADHAVETFLRFVRDPVRGTATDPQEASARLVQAFRTMLPATGALVGSHFRRLLLTAARARLEEDDGDTAS